LARARLPDILFLRHGSNRLCRLYDPILPRADLHSLIQYASGHLNETHPTGNAPLVGILCVRRRSVMLKYKCLLCGIEWGDPGATELDISHGCCPACIRNQYTSRIHRAQLEAGYSDCFNRGYNDCAEDGCCFRAACQEELIKGWKRAVIQRASAAEPERLTSEAASA